MFGRGYNKVQQSSIVANTPHIFRKEWLISSLTNTVECSLGVLVFFSKHVKCRQEGLPSLFCHTPLARKVFLSPMDIAMPAGKLAMLACS
jgi:hypothetical protein